MTDMENIVRKEIIVKFKQGVLQEFAKEFIKHNSNSVKENQSSDLWKIASSIIVEVPKGKEKENCDYYNTIRFVEEAKFNYKPEIYVQNEKIS